MPRKKKRRLGVLNKELLVDMEREHRKVIRDIESNEMVWESECNDTRNSDRDRRFSCMGLRMTGDARRKLQALNQQIDRRVSRGS